MDTLDIQPRYLSDTVKITGLSGREPSLVVSFTGIGKPEHTEQHEEFVRQGAQGGVNHVLFVSDTTRSWFNRAGVFEEITEFIQQYKATHGITRVATFGNSMGGYGAIQFARALEADVCLAISAQYSANPKDVPDETRWRNWRDLIAEFTMPPLVDVICDTTTYFILNGEAEKERQHYAQFPTGENIHHYLLRDAGHAVGRRLKETGQLKKTIRLALGKRTHQFSKHMENIGAYKR
ncbi:MAG: hypothetical protein V3V13_09490 [Paracoccaceae bacterium]